MSKKETLNSLWHIFFGFASVSVGGYVMVLLGGFNSNFPDRMLDAMTDITVAAMWLAAITGIAHDTFVYLWRNDKE